MFLVIFGCSTLLNTCNRIYKKEYDIILHLYLFILKNLNKQIIKDVPFIFQ